jgi:hypothetical protein
MRTIPIIYVIIFLLMEVQTTYSQADTSFTFGDEETDPEFFLGFNLVPDAMGDLCHFALIKPEKDGTIKIKQITRESFIAQAKGKEASFANPKSVDLFRKFTIENPNIINELWRLRYKDYPYQTKDPIDPGWSTNDSIPFLPSKTQFKTLENFGMFRMNDYIYGDNAFRLLQMMTKPEWVKIYKESI